MEQFNTLLNKQLDDKDVDIKIASVPYWNLLSIDDIDTEFDNEFHEVISDDDVPPADEYQRKDEPIHTPEMFNSCIDMEIGLPMGLDG